MMLRILAVVAMVGWAASAQANKCAAVGDLRDPE